MKRLKKECQYWADRGIHIFFDRFIGTFGEVSGALGAYWCFEKIRKYRENQKIESGDKVKIGFQIEDE